MHYYINIYKFKNYLTYYLVYISVRIRFTKNFDLTDLNL